jgi:hypothetical protein
VGSWNTVRVVDGAAAPADIEMAMWNEPYLETCCRSALNRLKIAGPIGRPPGLKDGPCLARLAGMGLAHERADGRFEATEEGLARHASEILKSPRPATAQPRASGSNAPPAA